MHERSLLLEFRSFDLSRQLGPWSGVTHVERRGVFYIPLHDLEDADGQILTLEKDSMETRTMLSSVYWIFAWPWIKPSLYR